MKAPWAFPLVQWVIGPLAVFALAGALGARLAPRGKFFDATAALPPSERAALESVPLLAAANVTWALGSLESVKNMLRFELDRLPESDGKNRARTLLRFGIVDENPEGQAAVFAQACVADATVCDRLKEAAERETGARFVSPGNHLPLYFVPNHPPILGP